MGFHSMTVFNQAPIGALSKSVHQCYCRMYAGVRLNFTRDNRRTDKARDTLRITINQWRETRQEVHIQPSKQKIKILSQTSAPSHGIKLKPEELFPIELQIPKFSLFIFFFIWWCQCTHNLMVLWISWISETEVRLIM